MFKKLCLLIGVTIIGTTVSFDCFSAELSRRNLLRAFVAVVAASQIPEIPVLESPSVASVVTPNRHILTPLVQEIAEIRNIRFDFLKSSNPESFESILRFYQRLEKLDLQVPRAQAIKARYVRLTQNILAEATDIKYETRQAAKTREVRSRLGKNLMYDIVLVRSLLPFTLLNKINSYEYDSEHRIVFEADERQALSDYVDMLKQLQKTYEKTVSGYEILNTFIQDARTWYPSLETNCSIDLKRLLLSRGRS